MKDGNIPRMSNSPKYNPSARPMHYGLVLISIHQGFDIIPSTDILSWCLLKVHVTKSISSQAKAWAMAIMIREGKDCIQDFNSSLVLMFFSKLSTTIAFFILHESKFKEHAQVRATISLSPLGFTPKKLGLSSYKISPRKLQR